MAKQETKHALSSEELQILAHTSPSGLAFVTNLKRSPEPGEYPSRWIHARHVALLDEYLVKLHSRALRTAGYVGMIVEEPPRHGKSELATHYDSVYYLGAHPDDKVILATYAAEFGQEWGRKCRGTFEEWAPSLYGLEVSRDSRAADRWDIAGHKGGMITAGAGGPITGRGANYLKADDLIKNYAEAQSETLRNNVWNWWTSTFRTRLEPGGIILVIGTRWHEDDIIGRLLRQQGDGPQGLLDPLYGQATDKFLRIRLPAVAEEPDEEFPDPDPIGRKPGEVLFPERWPLEELAPHMENELTWAALFQQRPTPTEGYLFHEEWFEIVPHPGGKFKRIVRWWDMAATDEKKGEDPDWTVGLLLGEHENGLYYVLDVVRFRASPGLVEARMRRQSVADKKSYPSIRFRVEREPGAQGKLYARVLSKTVFRGLPFRAIPSSGSKTLRADTVAGAAEREEVKLVRAPWNKEFLREVKRFPFGSKDDQVDALSGSYTAITSRSGQAITSWG